MKMYNYTPETLTELANQIKEVFIGSLHNEGLIKNPDEIAANYAIVITERNSLGKMWSKLWHNEDPDGVYISCVKSTNKIP